MDKLVTERQEEQSSSSKLYQIILAPFYYKFGDSITTFIELNTDEFGNVKTLQQDDSSEEEEESEEEAEIDDPREESKDEPVITTDEV